ncbi:MAG: hypothetical protein WD003_02710 [Candidatus Paceibacterota bacterium]
MVYKKSLMRKIYAIWLFRQVFNMTTAKLAVIGGLIWQLTFYVSFGQVVRNMPSFADVNASYTFLESALLNTEATTQVIMLGILILITLFLWDMRRKMAYSF